MDSGVRLTESIATSFRELAAFGEEWHDLATRVGSPIYMTMEWCSTCWDFYGHGRRLRVMQFRDRGKIVAVIPLYVETLRIGPIAFRLARLVGANIPPKVFDPPVVEAYGEEVYIRVGRFAAVQ